MWGLRWVSIGIDIYRHRPSTSAEHQLTCRRRCATRHSHALAGQHQQNDKQKINERWSLHIFVLVIDGRTNE